MSLMRYGNAADKACVDGLTIKADYLITNRAYCTLLATKSSAAGALLRI